ncbi:MAG: phosphate ABC transporter permease subunit PstC [Elusimicrobia bacterium CG1_02_63_36]|nr:MAG: phosphate ABC transporter permease subunit PstC [Elusimicrobia bacterium CG1_02_63_36]
MISGFGLLVVALAVGLAAMLYLQSRGTWHEFGLSFITSSEWNPVEGRFGAWPFIFGTLYSSALALLIAVPLGVGSAIFLAELAPKRVSAVCTFLIELLAAIPSVVLGLMGVFVLVPAIRSVEPWINKTLGFIPLFKGAPYGVGMFAAALILSIMILPFITSIARDVLLAVPRPLKEAVLALGATRWEMVVTVCLPHARAGILGAVFLALGRALGETMAVTMVIGNMVRVSWSLLDPGYTMAAVIANEFAEAVEDAHVKALIAIGLCLFGITVIVNGLARLLIYKTVRKTS